MTVSGERDVGHRKLRTWRRIRHTMKRYQVTSILTVLCFLLYWLATADLEFAFWRGKGIEETDFYRGGDEESLVPRNVLVLSSTGRSGSTFLAELVASQKGNALFFEPERTLGASGAGPAAAREEVERSLRCRIRDDLLRADFGAATVRLSSPLRCGHERWVRADLPRARRICERLGLRVVKTVGVRLEWMRRLMEDESLGLRIIHLVRDPRGSLLSQREGGWKDEDVCRNIMQDLEYKSKMEKDFPDRYFFIRYEDLCRNLIDKTIEILMFLNGQSLQHPSSTALQMDTLECVSDFLQSHNQTGFLFYSTYRDTLSVFQMWRNRISQDMLTDIEEKCGDVISASGYTFFHTVDNARNFSISITDEKKMT